MGKITAVFQASRKELWAALSAANLTEGITWKQSSREQMIAIAIKADINHVNVIGESDEILKKLAKTFTPSFFKSIRDLEQVLASVADVTDTTETVATEPETDITPELALKKN